MTDQFTITFTALFVESETRVALTHQQMLALVKKLESQQRHGASAIAKEMADEIDILISLLRELREEHIIGTETGSCLLPTAMPAALIRELPPILKELDATIGHALAELANLKNDLVRLQRYELASTVRDTERLLNRYRHWVTRIEITL